ncbi:YaaL family protein [Clostridium sp. E02]|uniref:YaaL family protein n=1 Tax=Clostridium sp. E02 TaxID=2487134 RepID=UPI000F5343BD|nr:YaaL family protein [Clostridium sp. E02]
MKHAWLGKHLIPSEEERSLRCEIERSKTAIEAARNHFEHVIDPTLIDCYIYELNAAQLRYQFLLRRFKSREFSPSCENRI